MLNAVIRVCLVIMLSTMLLGCCGFTASVQLRLSSGPDRDSKKAKSQISKKYSGLSFPVGMGFDKNGNLYVSNWSAGNVADNLPSPSGMVETPDGNLLIACAGDDSIYELILPRQ